jgi:acetyl-CoA carboxylase carboxyltransferase component
VLRNKKIAAIENAEERAAYVAQAEEEYKEKFANPYKAAEYGYIDDVIEPRNTRFRIIRALQALATKKDYMPDKKHANLPL